MSEENIQLVRGFIEGYGRRNADEMVEWVEENWDAEGDFYPARKYPGSSPCHGREEISRFFTDFRAAWGNSKFAIKDIIPVGDVRVLAKITVLGEGRESGIKLEGDLYLCYWLRHGRILRQEDHMTVAGALHALGLKGESLEAAGLEE
jgi:hypothetical protein